MLCSLCLIAAAATEMFADYAVCLSCSEIVWGAMADYRDAVVAIRDASAAVYRSVALAGGAAERPWGDVLVTAAGPAYSWAVAELAAMPYIG